jgi:hypothetical protein
MAFTIATVSSTDGILSNLMEASSIMAEMVSIKVDMHHQTIGITIIGTSLIGVVVIRAVRAFLIFS